MNEAAAPKHVVLQIGDLFLVLLGAECIGTLHSRDTAQMVADLLNAQEAER